MATRTVFLFSGQGSHHFQMAGALYQAEPEFRQFLDQFNQLYADLTGQSVLDQLYGARDQAQAFDQLIFTHPSIVMVECALAQMLMRQGIVPAAALGCSVGSFAAAATCGFISFEEAVAMAVRQARTVEERCEIGAMCAVLGKRTLHGKALTSLGASIAGESFDGHFTISALAGAMDDIAAWLRVAGLAHQRLPVRYAFHSPWLDPAKAQFQLQSVHAAMQTGHCEMWCSAAASPVASLPDSYFWDAVREPIRFAQTIALLESKGPWRYLDLGPAGTLATFLKYLLPRQSRSEVMAALDRSGRDVQCMERIRSSHNAFIEKPCVTRTTPLFISNGAQT